MQVLLCISGMVIGSLVTIVLLALVTANKRDDIEHYKWESYKQGYEKGYDDGFELKQKHKD